MGIFSDIQNYHSADERTNENIETEFGTPVRTLSGGELTAEVTADYLRREHLPDRAFSSEKARYHRPAGTMPEEGVVIQRRYNKSQAA